MPSTYADDATFLNSLTAMRFCPGHSVSVVNDELIESTTEGSRITPLPEPEDRVDAIVEHFGMPLEVVRDALSHLGELQGTQGGPVDEPDAG